MQSGNAFLKWCLAIALWSLPTLNSHYEVTTIAGVPGENAFVNGIGINARFNYPAGITSDSHGNLYVTEAQNNVVRKITPDGMVTTVIGTGGAGLTDGTGNTATFKNPYGISVDSIGNLYVADTGNHAIRKITPEGIATTIAGNGALGSTDGNGIDAKFRIPFGITIDSANNLYVADTGNNTIRKITPAGDVTTFAGTAGVEGNTNGDKALATFNGPHGLSIDNAGVLYIADTSNCSVRKIDTNTGQVDTMAGGNTFGSMDGTGADARFTNLYGVTVDSTGNLYVADTNNNIIRKITPAGVVTTIAGKAGIEGSTDGKGADARFNNPTGITVDADGNIYVTDWSSHVIRKIVWVPDPPSDLDIEKPPAASGGSIGSATTTAIGHATEGAGEGGEEEESDFRFAHSPERIKLSMGNMTGAFMGNGRGSTHTRTLAALEKALGAAQGMKQISQNMTLWASGVYSQGQIKPMYGNPAASEKHYGIMAGTHYYHKPTKQLIGVALDLGLGDSFVRHDHEMKNTYRSKQVTAYYGKGLGNDWNINVHGSFMRIDSSHHRPYTNNATRNIAVSHGKSHVMSGMVEVSHKYKPSQNVHLKSSFGGIYGRTKQFAYKETNAGDKNLEFGKTTMNETSLKVGLKLSLLQKSGEHKTYGLYPHANYTRYVKTGTVQQKITSLNDGQSQLIKSGTAGKNLISLGLGAGVTDSDANTKVQVGYTANFQKYRKSHEVMMKYSIEF